MATQSGSSACYPKKGTCGGTTNTDGDNLRMLICEFAEGMLFYRINGALAQYIKMMAFTTI